MDTRKILDVIPDKTLNRLLLIGLPGVMMALVILAVTIAQRSKALEMRQFLSTLTARDITQVDVTPEEVFHPEPEAPAETGPRAATIATSASVQKLLTAYQQASSYGPGGGRLSGWKAQVNFHLLSGRVIYSTVYQNDYASLLFITSDSTSGPSSPDDCLMSQSAGGLVKQLSRQ
jgi:hypothetical protein